MLTGLPSRSSIDLPKKPDFAKATSRQPRNSAGLEAAGIGHETCPVRYGLAAMDYERFALSAEPARVRPPF